MYPSDLTVVGVYDGRRMMQFVQGSNLHEFPASIAESAMLVTFFGTGFDLPFLRRAFPDLRLPQLHVDLCYLYRRLGLKGGLKSIETRMGIRRSADTTGLSGLDAVHLWYEHQHGRKGALDTLLAYNAEDVKNMAALLAEGYRQLSLRVLEGEA